MDAWHKTKFGQVTTDIPFIYRILLYVCTLKWSDEEETTEYWNAKGQDELKLALERENLNKLTAKNIIMFLGRDALSHSKLSLITRIFVLTSGIAFTFQGGINVWVVPVDTERRKLVWAIYNTVRNCIMECCVQDHPHLEEKSSIFYSVGQGATRWISKLFIDPNSLYFICLHFWPGHLIIYMSFISRKVVLAKGWVTVTETCKFRYSHKFIVAICSGLVGNRVRILQVA